LDTSYFDAVVCGADLAGLATAALLGRRGLRVLVCGLDRVPATFNAGGYTLAREAGLLPAPDAEPVARVMRELNYVQIIRRRAPALQPAFQLVLPGHRLDFGPPEVLARELAREFPAEAAPITAALGRLQDTSATLEPLLGSDLTLPPDGFWERREVARVEGQLPPPTADLLAPLPADHPVRAGLTALAALSTGFAPADLNAVVQARTYDLARRGTFRLDGGLTGLRALFLDRIGTSSGEVRERVTPVELVLKRGRVAGLRVRPRDETIGLDHLVWAGPLSGLLPLCPDEKASRKLRELAGSVRPACYRYTLCLLLRPAGVPEGLGPRAIAVRDPAQPLIEDNALSITLGAEDHQRNVVPVWVDCLVPAAAASGEGYLAVLRARLRERLGRLLPFFDRHLVVMASPHDGLPPELSAAEPSIAEPEPIPATPMTPALTSDLPRAVSVSGAPHATGIKNLVLASGENLPGLGREGELVSAWGAARLIAGPQPRREAGRREIVIEDT
jgi:phytoene dehydrogenase-like protein